MAVVAASVVRMVILPVNALVVVVGYDCCYIFILKVGISPRWVIFNLVQEGLLSLLLKHRHNL